LPVNRIYSFLPVLHWLPGYRKKWIRADLANGFQHSFQKGDGGTTSKSSNLDSIKKFLDITTADAYYLL